MRQAARKVPPRATTSLTKTPAFEFICGCLPNTNSLDFIFRRSAKLPEHILKPPQTSPKYQPLNSIYGRIPITNSLGSILLSSWLSGLLIPPLRKIRIIHDLTMLYLVFLLNAQHWKSTLSHYFF
jgi:hypothetical protein